jgi:tetratricopeptide (TPR) repeat protein
MMLLLLFGSALAQSPAFPPAAPTQAETDRAKELFRLGAAAYEEGRYEDAVELFLEAHALTRNPKILFNIANARERMGDLPGCLAALREYLGYTIDEERQVISRRIATLEQRIATARTPEPPATPTTSATTIPVAPGYAVVPVDQLRGAAGPQTRPNSAKWILFGVSAGSATVGGAAAGVTYALGRSYRGLGDEASYEGTRRWNNFAVAATGVALTGAIVGLALPSRTAAASAVSVGLDGITVAGRF